ncbi:tyrosine-type recombinase/integrase [Acinetobacter sp. YIM 103518]|uniref:Tyrosine-type recombinase/integrase n=1 Tax=Acinetobacter faecalis TaxID=2665161 RepID=A0A6L6GBM8_9GAMM|nr:tyrosine-type recombinase/integrase [Acinetobacter faecalis]MTD09855.1 tyrosine-type recombinase/integrase [Acinetobacter faecalis]
MKLNKSNVDAIVLTEKGQAIHRDSDLIGFAVRATTKSKSYIVERRHEGKLYRVTIGKTNEITPVEAKKKAQTILADIANGEYEKKKEGSNEVTLEQAFDLYLKQRKLKPLSINTYHHCIDTFLSDWKSKPIFEISKKDVFDRFIKLTEYSPTQANLTLKMFGSIWRFAQVHWSTDENPILKHNPIDVIPAKRGWNKTKARTRHLDESNIHVFYNAVLNYFTERSLYDDASKNAVRDLVLFIMYTGCRRNEAQTLKWENVDIEKGLFIFKDPKNGDDHLLPMGDHLFEIIKQRYELKNNEYVFPGSNMVSKAKHVSGAQGLLEAVREQTGIEISLHDLRRTFATICNNLDYGPYTIKRLLNHRSGAKNDVTGGYVQVSIKKLRLAMNDIEAVYQGKLNCFD